MTDQ
jgi:hypothetical protein